MSRRHQTELLVLALLGGTLIGVAIGYSVRTPGRASTWSDIRAWATFVVVVAGFSIAAYQLNLQRLQFADEARRNIARDELLDLQRDELRVAQLLREREQAEAMFLSFSDLPDSTAIVRAKNQSRRPMREIACQLDPGNDKQLVRPEHVNQLLIMGKEPDQTAAPMPAEGDTDGWRVARLRPDKVLDFTFARKPGPVVDDRFLLRFTDDAGLHWELDSEQHLLRLANRDDW